jgi:catechol 2,3-dioxygenase-like lactoylglutathione lyase family enzyme
VTQLKSLMVGFGVRDLNAALDFYTTKLGFHVTFRNGAVFAIVARDCVEISLAQDRPGAKSGHASCYLKLEGIGALHEELISKGVSMSHPLKTESYGMREFMITDPDGNTLNFGQPVEK